MTKYDRFKWDGDKLLLHSKNTGVKILPDRKYPGMFRVEYPKGTISDMFNLERAQDAAMCLAASDLKAALDAERGRLGALKWKR